MVKSKKNSSKKKRGGAGPQWRPGLLGGPANAEQHQLWKNQLAQQQHHQATLALQQIDANRAAQDAAATKANLQKLSRQGPQPQWTNPFAAAQQPQPPPQQPLLGLQHPQPPPQPNVHTFNQMLAGLKQPQPGALATGIGASQSMYTTNDPWHDYNDYNNSPALARLKIEKFGVTNSEGRNKQSFINRSKDPDKKPGYRRGRTTGCPHPDQKYELSELKTSLLLSRILQDNGHKSKLRGFLKGICSRFCDIVEFDYQTLLTSFAKTIPTTSNELERLQHHPIGQFSQVQGNPKRIESDFFLMYNFTHFLWESMNIHDTFQHMASSGANPPLESLKKIMSLHLFTKIVQDFIRMPATFARGGRWEMRYWDPSTYPQQQGLQSRGTVWTDEEPGTQTNVLLATHGEGDETRLPTDQIGITNLYHQDLVLHNNPHWSNVGKATCFSPYSNLYGSHLLKARESGDDSNYHSSILCGVSGSIWFVFFTFVYSFSNIPAENHDSKLLKQNIQMIIFTVSSMLASDGGHNIRELITGLTTGSIVAKGMMSTIHFEFERIQGNTIIDKLNNLKTMNIDDGVTLSNFFYINKCKFLLWIMSYTKDLFNNSGGVGMGYYKQQPGSSWEDLFYNILQIIHNVIPLFMTFYDELSLVNPYGIEMDTDLFNGVNNSSLRNLLNDIGGNSSDDRSQMTQTQLDNEENFYLWLKGIVYQYAGYRRDGTSLETGSLPAQNISDELRDNTFFLLTVFEGRQYEGGGDRVYRRFENAQGHSFWDGPTITFSRICENLFGTEPLNFANYKVEERAKQCNINKSGSSIPLAGGAASMPNSNSSIPNGKFSMGSSLKNKFKSKKNKTKKNKLIKKNNSSFSFQNTSEVNENEAKIRSALFGKLISEITDEEIARGKLYLKEKYGDPYIATTKSIKRKMNNIIDNRKTKRRRISGGGKKNKQKLTKKKIHSKKYKR